MKNLFVLPTDKPSRLFVYDGKLGLAKEFQYGSDAIQNQKIYITNEEKTKYGDWCIDLDSYFVFEFATPYKNKRVKKIILTTDPKLIKDGVQAIDDEFLEWFVKNPSCEELKIGIEIWNDGTFSYRIIIPKEEPKQDSVYKCTCLRPQVNCFSGMCSYCNRQIVKNLTTEDLKPKIVGEYQQELFNYLHDLGVIALQSEMQEIERIVLGMQQENSNINALHFEIDALKREIKALKHQQEQDKNKYSEEDMIEASKYGYNFHKTTQFPNIKFEDSCIRNFQQWLTIFKKK